MTKPIERDAIYRGRRKFGLRPGFHLTSRQILKYAKLGTLPAHFSNPSAHVTEVGFEWGTEAGARYGFFRTDLGPVHVNKQ